MQGKGFPSEEAFVAPQRSNFLFSLTRSNRLWYNSGCISVPKLPLPAAGRKRELPVEDKRILFLANVPSPYRVAFFNTLSRDCRLTVLYQLHASAERDEKWTAAQEGDYETVYLKGRATDVDKALCPGVISWLEKGWDAIVICGNSSPTELLAISWCKLRRIPYCLEGDGAFAKGGQGLKERIKARSIRGANLYLSTCHELDKYYLHYGAKPEALRRYRFSSLTRSDILPAPVGLEDKRKLRRELGIPEEKMLLSVGQFIPRKGFDILLQAVNTMDKHIGVYIIGGVPTEEYLTYAKENDLTNVHFVGFKTKQELESYYLAADLFVLPTREDIWGLVVEEAMSCGLGVITTDRCNAGLTLIENGKNGFLVPVDDVHALRMAITDAIVHSAVFGAAALETVRPYTIENMAADHLRILADLKKEG